MFKEIHLGGFNSMRRTLNLTLTNIANSHLELQVSHHPVQHQPLQHQPLQHPLQDHPLQHPSKDVKGLAKLPKLWMEGVEREARAEEVTPSLLPLERAKEERAKEAFPQSIPRLERAREDVRRQRRVKQSRQEKAREARARDTMSLPMTPSPEPTRQEKQPKSKDTILILKSENVKMYSQCIECKRIWQPR